MLEQEETAYICKSCLPEIKSHALATIKDAQKLFTQVCQASTPEDEPVVFVSPVLKEFLINTAQASKQETHRQKARTDDTTTSIALLTSSKKPSTATNMKTQEGRADVSANEILKN